MTPTTLITDRLVLRQWRDDDLEPFADLNGDPDALRFFPSTLARAESDELANRLRARIDERGFGLWAVEVRPANSSGDSHRIGARGEFAGFTGLNPMPDWTGKPGEFEIGWRFRTRFRGRGLATEAAAGARDFAFGDLGLPRLWSFTAVLNEPSMAVMRRIGMTEDHRFGHPVIPQDHPVHAHVMFRMDNPG